MSGEIGGTRKEHERRGQREKEKRRGNITYIIAANYVTLFIIDDVKDMVVSSEPVRRRGVRCVTCLP